MLFRDPPYVVLCMKAVCCYLTCLFQRKSPLHVDHLTQLPRLERHSHLVPSKPEPPALFSQFLPYLQTTTNNAPPAL